MRGGFNHPKVQIDLDIRHYWYKKSQGFGGISIGGDKSVQLLFIGTTTQKDIDKKVKDQINKFNKKFKLKLKYQEHYTQSIRFSGNFKDSLREARDLVNDISYKYSLRKYQYRDSSTYKYKNKKYSKPYSWVLNSNRQYSLYDFNCLHASLLVLLYGSLNKRKNDFKFDLLDIMADYTIPNNAMKRMKKLNYGKWVEC